MKTILAIFILSFIFATLLTPLVTLAARHLKLFDTPSDRKIHLIPIPRVGGIALFLAFFMGLSACLLYETLIPCMLLQEPMVFWLAAGAALIFGLGLVDDIWRLGYLAKFAIQILAGIIAYMGGLRIEVLTFLPHHSLLQIGLSLPLTVFWVVLVINAINLIDGLDGLAAGVGFLVCLVLLILCVLGDRFVPATILSAMAGSLLGFLVFNSRPASIFMGDSGSYFIGFVIASVSIMGSFKGQTAASILIPMVALGFPLMDTLWSTLRRFIYGQKLFSPDRDHIHHRLMALGLTQQRAVWFLYGITVIMGCFSFAMVYTHDNKTALLLLLFAAGIIIGMRRLGYFDFFRMDSFLFWLKDMSDESGLSLERRTFLNFQMAIQRSKNIEQMWESLSAALQSLNFDLMELRLENLPDDENPDNRFLWWNKQRKEDGKDDWNAFLKRESLMKLELPLTSDKENYGTLWLVKDLKQEPLSHYTLRRIEHLRRTVIRSIEKMG